MKNLYTIVAILAIAVLLAGCTKKAEAPEQKAPELPAIGATPAGAAAPATGDVVQQSDQTLNEIDKSISEVDSASSLEDNDTKQLDSDLAGLDTLDIS